MIKVDCFHIRFTNKFHISINNCLFVFNALALALLFYMLKGVRINLIWQHYLSPIDIIVC